MKTRLGCCHTCLKHILLLLLLLLLLVLLVLVLLLLILVLLRLLLLIFMPLLLLLRLLRQRGRSERATVYNRTRKMTKVEGGAEIMRQSSIADGGQKGRKGRSRAGQTRNQKGRR